MKRPLAYTLLNFIYKASLPLLCHILLVSQCYLSISQMLDVSPNYNIFWEKIKLIGRKIIYIKIIYYIILTTCTVLINGINHKKLHLNGFYPSKYSSFHYTDYFYGMFNQICIFFTFNLHR